MAKEFEYEYNPIKEQVGGKAAEKVIWSTSVIQKALEGIQQGQPLKASPFLNKNTKLLKPELVRKYTQEEIEDYKRCAMDPVYFGEKCYLQLFYIDHLMSFQYFVVLILFYYSFVEQYMQVLLLHIPLLYIFHYLLAE